MSNHQDALDPLFQNFVSAFRAESLAFLNNPICATCATKIYLNVLAAAMVATYQSICEEVEVEANPLELVGLLKKAWEQSGETMQ